MSRAAFVRACMLAAILAGLTGCALAPDALYLETEHVSHPFAGQPFFGPKYEEDWLDQVNAGAEWRKGGAYLQTSVGYVYTDGGFHGPPLTFTARAGYRFPINKERP